MIKIDFAKFIYNRMWFGWWYSYSWHPLAVAQGFHPGTWQRDYRYTICPIVLVSDTFEFENPASEWSKMYGDI